MDGKSFSFSFPFGIKSLLIASILTFNHWQSSGLVDACSDSYLYFLYATENGQIKAVNKDSNAVVTVLDAQGSENDKIGGVTTKVRGDNLYYCSNKQIYLGDYFSGGDGELIVDMKDEDESSSNGISGSCSYITFDTSLKRDGGQEDIFYMMDEDKNIYYIEDFDTTVAKEDASKIVPTKVDGLKLSPTLNEVEVHNGHLYYASRNTLVRATRKGHYIQLFQTDNEILSTALHPSESVIYYMEAGVGVWALNFKSMPFNPTLIYKTNKITGITLSGDSSYTVEGRGPFAKDPNLYIFDIDSQVITAINMNTKSTLSSESLVQGHDDIKIMMDMNTVEGLMGDSSNTETSNIPFISTFGMGCCTCEETLEPTPGPSAHPTSPTAYPTLHPTRVPSPQPSNHPTPSPTSLPTHRPTPNPTPLPTGLPTSKPTKAPTPAPTALPTGLPTERPTSSPSSLPTSLPTGLPTSTPTPAPTMHPTHKPTPHPTEFPTAEPTHSPSSLPTSEPTAFPTSYPTTFPTSMPTTVPTKAPTQCDTVCYHELYELTDTFDTLQAKVTKLHAQEEEKLHRMLKDTSLSIKMHSSHSRMQQQLDQTHASGSENVNLESSEPNAGHSTMTLLITTFSSVLVSFFVGTVIEKLRFRNRSLNSNLDRV